MTEPCTKTRSVEVIESRNGNQPIITEYLPRRVPILLHGDLSVKYDLKKKKKKRDQVIAVRMSHVVRSGV